MTILLLIMTIKSGAPHLLLVASSALAGLGMPGLVAIFLARSQQIGGGDDAPEAGIPVARGPLRRKSGQPKGRFA